MQPKVPLGKPLELTDEELDLLSQITPEDIKKANERWRKVVEPEIKTLLETTEVIQ